MKLNIYDKDLNRICIIGDNYKSCLWNEGYNSVEPFTLELNSIDEYRQKIKEDFYVGRSDRTTLMVIKDIVFNKDTIVVSGKQATRVLDDVAFIGTITEGGRIDESIKSAYNSSNKYYNLFIDDPVLDETYNHQISNKSMLELCQTMCEDKDIGFKVVKRDKKCVLQLYKPVKKENLVFSEKFRNLTLKEIAISNDLEKNYAIVLGQGEGVNRTRVDVDISGGLQRKELIVDSRNLQKGEDESQSDYEERLRVEGLEKLLETITKRAYSFFPNVGDFGIKYDLGDILEIRLPEFNSILTARVVRFSEKSQGNISEISVEVGKILVKRGRRL